MDASSDSASDDAVLVSQDADGGEGANHALVVKNLGLVQRFVSAIYADPSLLDDFSSEINVVLMPIDDPELAAINRRGGVAMQKAGKPVRFVDV